jgi:hypothetical protein
MAKIYHRELKDVSEELDKALLKLDRMKSAHEGYAVILEELDELWDEVKRKQSKRRPDKMRKEAVQVAAMALRFVMDLCK